jgi:hypothetical protein
VSIEAILDRLEKEWPVITAAPFHFALAVLIMGVVLWVIIRGSYSVRLSSAKAMNELKDAQLADYKAKLGSAPPDTIKQKIEGLETTVAAMKPHELVDAERPSAPLPAAPTAKSPLSAYDQEKKLRLIDEQIMPILKGDMVKLAVQTEDLSHWENHIKDQDKFGNDLDDLTDLYNRTAQRLATIRREHEQYEGDIGQLLNQDYQGPFNDGLRDYGVGITSLGRPPTGNYAVFVNPLAEKLRIGLVALQKWRHDRETRFLALRKEIGG